MKQRKPNLYMHEDTGEIVTVSKKQAEKLPPKYKKIRFVKNERGKRVMRLELNGATVDISENEQVIESTANVNASTV